MAAEILAATLSSDVATRQQAEDRLLEWEKNQYEDFLGGLVMLLSASDQPDNLRMSAALQIKRSLTGQDDFTRRQKQERWFSLAENSRNVTKTASLTVLATASVMVSKQAAQVIEALARCELSTENKWPELSQQLVLAFDKVFERNPHEVIGPLVALGYFANVATHADLELKEDEVNNVLMRISKGMAPQMPGDVQAAAAASLSDTVEFARHNMEKDDERAQIMKMIMDVAQSPSDDAKEKAFQCLTTVLTMYYHLLRPHMEEIWKVTTAAIVDPNGDERVARQALNFWDEMAYEESLRVENANAAANHEIPPLGPEEECFGFIVKVQQPLCDLVLNRCLLSQPEEPDEDGDDSENSLHNAAEHCLSSMSGCLGAALLPVAFSYAEQNIQQADWRKRQAALFALGTVLRDNDMNTIAEQVNSVFPSVLRYMSSEEPVSLVRETAAWTMTHIAPQYPILGAAGQHMIIGLITGLKDRPRVAHLAATGIYAFAATFAPVKDNQTNQLSGEMFHKLTEELWNAARREDSGEFNLLTDAYEALIKLIEMAGHDMFQFIGQTLLVLSLVRINEIREGKVVDSSGFQEVELCSVVHSCLVKLDEETALFKMPGDETPLPSKIMDSMMGVLQRPGSNAHPDAIAVISELVRVFGEKFGQMLPTFLDVALNGLRAHGNSQVCIAAVRLCSDVFAIETKAAPMDQVMPNLMPLIYENLKSTDLQRDVKPPHLTLLGDIAANIGPAFRPYFNDAMGIALEAAELDVDVMDEDLAGYLNELREASIEAMNFMVLDVEESMLQPFLPRIFNLTMKISFEVQNPAAYYQGKDPNFCPNESELRALRYRVSPGVIKTTLDLIGGVGEKSKTQFCQEVKKQVQSFSPLFTAGGTIEEAKGALEFAQAIVQRYGNM